jgi:hypothetical protein
VISVYGGYMPPYLYFLSAGAAGGMGRAFLNRGSSACCQASSARLALCTRMLGPAVHSWLWSAQFACNPFQFSAIPARLLRLILGCQSTEPCWQPVPYMTQGTSCNLRHPCPARTFREEVICCFRSQQLSEHCCSGCEAAHHQLFPLVEYAVNALGL